jgi:hypothetical protein
MGPRVSPSTCGLAKPSGWGPKRNLPLELQVVDPEADQAVEVAAEVVEAVVEAPAADLAPADLVAVGVAQAA